MNRRYLYLLSVAVIVWAGLIVPLPLSAIAPGTAPSIAPLLVVEADTTPINGDLRLLTVTVSQPSIVEAALAWLDDDVDINRRQTFIPEGLSRSEFFDLERQQFQQSGTIATAVGLELAGQPVDVITLPIVSGVIPQSPAEGILRPGDLVLEVNGEAVATADELANKSRRAEIGERIELRIRRGDEERDVTVIAGQVRGMTRPGVGVFVDTVIDALDLPFEIGLDPDIRIGGPSAGMMIALTVFDLVSDQDLAAGRVIAGTGEVLPDGGVGSIGGVREKVLAAVAAEADVLIVPRQQLSQALEDAPMDLEIIGVSTVREAIEALGGTPS